MCERTCATTANWTPFRTSLHVTRVAHALLAPNPADLYVNKKYKSEPEKRKAEALASDVQSPSYKKYKTEPKKPKAAALASDVQSPSSSSADGRLSAGQKAGSSVYVAAHPPVPVPPPPPQLEKAMYAWSQFQGWQLVTTIPLCEPQTRGQGQHERNKRRK